MTKQLAVVGSESSAISLDETFRLGDCLAQSGFFQDARTANQAVAKILLGREIGIGAMTSLISLHVVKGKPTLSSAVIASAIKASPKYDYKLKRLDDTGCDIEFYENGELQGVSTFTAQDAKKQQTQNTDKFPRNMFFARAISNGYKWWCPDVFGTSVYTPDEMGAPVDERGDMEPAAVKVGIAALPDEPKIIGILRNAENWDAVETEPIREALAWLKNNNPNDPLKLQVLAELRVRAKAVAPPADETPAPPEEVHAGEVVEDEPHPADALEPYAMQRADTPDASPSPLMKAVSEKRKAASTKAPKTPMVDTFRMQAEKAGLDFGPAAKEMRLRAYNAWLKDNAPDVERPVNSTNDIPEHVLKLMIADLGTPRLTW